MNHISALIPRNAAAPCLFYPAVRAMGLCVEDVLNDAQLQADVLVRIAQEYNVGAVVRMSELWCEGAAFGMECAFSQDAFPRLGSPIYADPEAMQNMQPPPAVNAVTAPMVEAVRLAVPQLQVPLIAGVTGPYTLGSVLGGSEDFMVNCMMEPEIAEEFLNKLTDFLIAYIKEYKAAGAAAVMIAEPSVCMLSPAMAEDMSNQYVERIIAAVQDENFSVIYHNCGDTARHMAVIAQLPAAAFHFGSATDISAALAAIPSDRLIMGNVEPQLFLGGDAAAVAQAADAAKNAGAGADNFRLSTGCDLAPLADINCVKTLLA